MKLEFRNDLNVAVSDQEPGSYFNNGEDIVLLRMPDADEIRQLWAEFSSDLRGELKQLMLQPYGDIASNLGLLGFRANNASDRAETLFGMLENRNDKSAHFRTDALSDAARALDLVPKLTAGGQARVKLAPGAGSILQNVLSKSKDQQRSLITRIVDEHENLDDWMLVRKDTEVGWAKLRDRVQSCADGAAFLEELANEIEILMGSNGHYLKPETKTKKRIVFAPSWFGQYLARRGIWLWPCRYNARMLYMYPARYSPLVTRMSVAPEWRKLADIAFHYQYSTRLAASSRSIHVFAAAALGGNTFQHEFRWYPLAAFKERSDALSCATTVSSSINTLYRLAIEHLQLGLEGREEAHLFLTSVRTGQIGVDAFPWTVNPTPRNTRNVQRILQRPVETIPDHVRLWAVELRKILPLFDLKTIKGVENGLGLWLVFLMTLQPEEAPLDFRSIDRQKHIHDLTEQNTHTFRAMLDAFYREDRADRGNSAIGFMERAFNYAAARDGFLDITNPIVGKVDRLPRDKESRPDMTPRKPLSLEAWELIVRENRRGNYALAASLGRNRCYCTLKNPDTGVYERVFWPAEAILIDVILNSGMRTVDARWVDSGEGDEEVLDRRTMKMVPNKHPAATRKRNKSFLQLVTLPGHEKQKIIGQRVGAHKTGKPYVIPWVDTAVVDAFEHMLNLQRRYNPISKPVKAKGRHDTRVNRTNEYLYEKVYPLFRDPRVELKDAISRDKVMFYWKCLLKHCQPLIDELLGQPYPLIIGDDVEFDLHSIRVTMVSHLLAAGVSIELVRDLVGHATWMMTWHYNGLRSARLHTSIQEAIHRRAEAHDRLASGDSEIMQEYLGSAIKPDFVPDHVGIEMFRSLADSDTRMPFEIFSHGICPRGSCATGGEKIKRNIYGRVWRDRACSGCRYRVTGPKFKDGIANRINNLIADLRISAKKVEELRQRSAQEYQRTGRKSSLEKLISAESSFHDNLARELSLEMMTEKMIETVEKAARAKGHDPDGLLLPAVPGFDESELSLVFVEAHEFRLMHTLVKETRLLPASLIEISPAVEPYMRKMVVEIARANNISDLFARLPEDRITDVALEVGDVLLERYSEPTKFQQLVDGIVRLDEDVVQDICGKVGLALEGVPGNMPLIGHAA